MQFLLTQNPEIWTNLCCEEIFEQNCQRNDDLVWNQKHKKIVKLKTGSGTNCQLGNGEWTKNSGGWSKKQ
jgi:hypothetical protein